MTTISIDLNTTSPADIAIAKAALMKLAKNIEPKNLMFLAELSEKPFINTKISLGKEKIRKSL